MAQTATNPKIEELRSRLKSDPKSRLFFPLAEELRKAGNCSEAEQVLRSGLNLYPTYLGAWVSLGRVLRDLHDDGAAVEALTRALQLDPGNVVAARLLGDAHLALGQKVEAIKKYKLVQALLPSDDELSGIIEQLDRDLHPPVVSAVEENPAPYQTSAQHDEALLESDAGPADSVSEDASPFAEPHAAEASPFESESHDRPDAEVEYDAEPETEPDSVSDEQFHERPALVEESPFDKTAPPFAEAARSYYEELRTERETGDVEPMAFAHEESPFEEPVDGYSADALAVEDPAGFQVTAAPLAADVPSDLADDLPAADSTPVFDTPQPAGVGPADASETATMADLYVRQGLVEEARQIYANILARDPDNTDVRAKLAMISPDVNPKVARLENWLVKVTRKEVGSV